MAPSVLHVAQSSEYGLGRYILDIVSLQVQSGWRVSVAGNPESWLRSRAIDAGVTWHDWTASRDPGVSSVAEARALQRIRREVAPDLLHLHSSKAGLLGRALVRGAVPTIFQPHGWSFFALHGAKRTLAIAWERLATRWCDVLLCVSDSERAEGAAALIDGPWVVVQTGVDSAHYAPGDRSAARRELGLPDGPLAVCAGRVSVHQKGQDTLVEAWRAVEAAVDGASLVILGEGPDRAMLESIAPASVRFPGGVDDVRPWFSAANVIAQPSRYEGFSLTVLEALACARSVVVTDSVGMRESVADAGAVVPIDDRDAIADALIERLQSPDVADAEGRRGRERVVERFSPDSWRTGMLDVASGLIRAQ